jgi:cellulose synthase/poly-beta-1,6-N-acetylglucosamine synthase-like glycosyltransferase
MSYYLQNYSCRDQLITENVPPDLGIIVVIPCCDEPDLNSSLQSLIDCISPICEVEVIIVINASENTKELILEQNKKTFIDGVSWARSHKKKGIHFYFIEENSLPKKHAGVGLARKIGMDEAVRRFENINKPDGVILCFDADAKCEKNYLIEVEKHFKKHPKTPACSIHFEHPIDGNEFPTSIYEGIIQYELHLRVYKNGLKYAGVPYAFHTVGSSMAVRSDVYQKQNGMNKRKAGEDFYFLQKLIPLGGFTEVVTTKVIPSPRVSNRVPFGTGKAMQHWIDGNEETIHSYHPNSYVDLKQFCKELPKWYSFEVIEIPLSVKAYLETINWQENVEKVRRNSTSEAHFVQLFYNWFNAFKVLKYMHFARDNYYKDISVFDVGNELLKLLRYEKQTSLLGLLNRFRELDKGE